MGTAVACLFRLASYGRLRHEETRQDMTASRPYFYVSSTLGDPNLEGGEVHLQTILIESSKCIESFRKSSRRGEITQSSSFSRRELHPLSENCLNPFEAGFQVLYRIQYEKVRSSFKGVKVQSYAFSPFVAEKSM